MPNLLDKFKKFVSDHGYKLVVSDTGISVEELARSLPGGRCWKHNGSSVRLMFLDGNTTNNTKTGSEEHNEETTNIIPE